MSQNNRDDKSKKHNYKVVVYPIQSDGEEHQKWKAKVDHGLFAFNHHHKWSLILFQSLMVPRNFVVQNSLITFFSNDLKIGQPHYLKA